MKKLNRLLSLGIVLSASLFLFSCKKEISRPLSNERVASTQVNTANDCDASVFGVYFDDASLQPNARWMTLGQKWYVNGEVKNLKAKSNRYTSSFFDPYLELVFDINWAEVVREGNQVRLVDVQNNYTIMRVTLDPQGRPVASYYYYNVPGQTAYWYDTTYYYYNGDKLENMVSLFETLSYTTVPIHAFRKYVFSYDSWGNVIRVDVLPSGTYTLQYDYSKPVNGMISNFQLTSSLKLLEYMDLLKLPMHHALTRSDFSPIGYPTLYKDYVITNGFVDSYVLDDSYSFRKVTFYNGWACGSNAAVNPTGKQGSAISNLKEFQDVYLKH